MAVLWRSDRTKRKPYCKSQISIDGVTYQLPANDNGNNLHSDHVNGYPKRLWNAEIVGNGVRFTLDDPMAPWDFREINM